MNKALSVKLVLVSGLVLSGLVPTAAPAGRAKLNTPKNTILVVTANLEEAWDYGDTQNHADMDRFVTRVLDEYKYKPDVLALQEVRKSSAVYVAKKLTNKSNQKYQVVVMPPKNPYFPYGGGRAGAKETTIVINVKTMKVLNGGGYFATVAKPAHETEPNDPVFHQAFALLQERSSGMKFATMSVHLLPRGYLASNDLDSYYRNKWSKQMHNKLRSRYGGRKGVKYLLAGDFNETACLKGAALDCKKERFWRTLRGIGYQDTSKDPGPVDYIFSKGRSGALHGIDSGYDKIARSRRYSDHPFRWTILGPDVYNPLPPKPLVVDLRKGNGGKPIVKVSWDKGDDRAGSGIARIEFDRKLNDGKWTRYKASHGTAHYDNELQWKDVVRYRVRAVDRAGNFSSYLRRQVEVLGENVQKI